MENDLQPIIQRAREQKSIICLITANKCLSELYDATGNDEGKKEPMEELRKAKRLNTETEFKRKQREDHESLLECQKKLRLVTKQRDIFEKELQHYRERSLQQEITEKDLKTTLAQEVDFQKQKIHMLEMEVEKLKKENSILRETKLQAKSLERELVTKDTELYAKEKTNFQLKVNLEGEIKAKEMCLLEAKKPVIIITEDEANHQVERPGLQTYWDTRLRQLVEKERRLRKKENTLAEREKEWEELQQSVSKQAAQKVPDEHSRCKRKLRELHEKMKVLQVEADVYGRKAQECKEENERLFDRKETIKKCYLKEKKMHTDLLEHLAKNGVKIPVRFKKHNEEKHCIPTVTAELQQDSTDVASKPEAECVQTKSLSFSTKALLGPEVFTITTDWSDTKTKASTGTRTPQEKRQQDARVTKSPCDDRVQTPTSSRGAALRPEEEPHQTITVTGEPCKVQARTNQVVLKPDQTPKTTVKNKSPRVRLPPISGKSHMVSQNAKANEEKVFMTETD